MKKIILFLLIIMNTAFASYKESFDKLTKNDKIIIEKVNSYFDNLQTLKTNFLQYDNNTETMSEGIFHLKKPDKIRFEYTYPFNSLLITNGKITTYYDIDMDEISTIPTKSVPQLLLLNSNLEKINATIISIENDETNIIINTKMLIKDDKYNVKYYFDKNIDNITTIEFKDNNNQSITLNLFKSEKNKELTKDLFIFKNPRLYNKNK